MRVRVRLYLQLVEAARCVWADTRIYFPRKGETVPDSPDIDRAVADLMAKLSPTIEAALRSAIEQGLGIGRNEIAKTLQSLLERPLPLWTPDASTTILGSASSPSDGDRAALGTVKPRILELISRRNGASVAEIEALGIKHNSIRGTLYSLQKDDRIERRGDRWFAVIKTEGAPSNESKGAP
jgi:hypothetical protein